MARRPGRITEHEVGLAALRIAASKAGGVATLHSLKRELRDYLTLSAEDQAQSETRPNEEMWEQQVRNLVSHRKTQGNIIAEGLADHIPRVGIRLTEAGRLHLKNKGLI